MAITPTQLDQQATFVIQQQNGEAFVRRQLFVLPPVVLSRLMGTDHITAEQMEAVPIAQAFKLLPTAQKISVLYRCIGISSTFHRLSLSQTRDHLCPTAQRLPAEALLTDMRQFEDDVRALTYGIITAYPMNPYRVLRMRAFAALERCLQHESIPKNLAKQILTTEGKHQSFKEVIQIFKEILFRIYLSFDLYMLYGSFIQIQDDILSMKDFFKGYLDVTQQLGDRGDKALLSDIKLLLSIIGFLEKSAAHPYLYLPILLTPLENLPLICNKGQDIQSLDPRLCSWLFDFATSVKIQSEFMLDAIRKDLIAHSRYNRTAYEFWRSASGRLSQHIISIATDMNALILKLQEYEKLSSRDQMANSSRLEVFIREEGALYQRFGVDLEHLHRASIAAGSPLINLFEGIKVTGIQDPQNGLNLKDVKVLQANQGFQYPLHYFRCLTLYVSMALVNSVTYFRKKLG